MVRTARVDEVQVAGTAPAPGSTAPRRTGLLQRPHRRARRASTVRPVAVDELAIDVGQVAPWAAGAEEQRRAAHEGLEVATPGRARRQQRAELVEQLALAARPLQEGARLVVAARAAEVSDQAGDPREQTSELHTFLPPRQRRRFWVVPSVVRTEVPRVTQWGPQDGKRASRHRWTASPMITSNGVARRRHHSTLAPPRRAGRAGSSFRWLRRASCSRFPVPTCALQLDALLRHLEIDGEFGGLALAATLHLAQARTTCRIAARAALCRRARAQASTRPYLRAARARPRAR